MRLALLLAATLALCGAAVAGDPPDPTETRVVRTGQGPCGAAAAHGSVWVAVYGAGRLLRIDPLTGRITRRLSVGSEPCRIAFDRHGAVWVTRDGAGQLVRVELRSGAMTRYPVGRAAFDVVYAAGSIWATSFDIGTVGRIDPVTRRLRRVYADGPNPAGLAYCRGRIWVGHGREARYLTSIDPTTNRVRRLPVGTQTPSWPRCIDGELWVTAPRTILRIDPLRGRVLGRLHVGGTPAEAALGADGLVWVTDKERSLVYRISPSTTSLTDSFAAGPGAYALARAGDAMWITSFGGSDVRRYTP